MQARDHLYDSPSRRVTEQSYVANFELLEQSFEILDVVFDEIRTLGTPRRVAMTPHVDRQHPVVARQVGCDVIECVRVAGGPVQGDHRRPGRIAPLEVMKPQAVDGDEAVRVLRLRDERTCRRKPERQSQDDQFPAARLHHYSGDSDPRYAAMFRMSSSVSRATGLFINGASGPPRLASLNRWG